MKILCVGGGSGGHVTPVAAIISEIQKRLPDSEIQFVTDQRFFAHSQDLMKPLGVPVSAVSAGKLRRYANLRWIDHFRHFFISYLPNFIDLFKLAYGVIQSLGKILNFRPDVVFVKGGYVGLPVGLAAALFWPKPPIVLHDSDAKPGLTNRILSRYACKIATGMPSSYSGYDPKKTEFTGIPISGNYHKISATEKSKLRHKYDIEEAVTILALGGSQGSTTINQAVLEAYPELKGQANFYLISGEDKFADVKELIAQHPRNYIGLRVLPYAKSELPDLIKLSDIVVTRAGATTMAELAAVGIAAVVIPSPYLASDHQTKNAQYFEDQQAAIVVNEDQLVDDKLLMVLKSLIDNSSERTNLGKNLAKFLVKDSARKTADMIIAAGGDNAKKK